MKILGIVAEYNPLHYGHEYQLKLARESYKADAVVVVMSGNFTQRGEPAILNKYIRAELAIKAGADLVVELPSYYSSGVLEDFALGAISVLDKLGFVDELLFGSECGDINQIKNIADAMFEDPKTYMVLRQGMRNGLTIEDANSTSLCRYALSPAQYYDMVHAITKPNNMLGIFYLIALRKLNSRIIPNTNARRGQNFDDNTMSDYVEYDRNFVSATAIREFVNRSMYMKNNADWFYRSMPEYTWLEIEKAYTEGSLIQKDALFNVFTKKLFENNMLMEDIVDLTEENKERILSGLRISKTYDEFISAAAKGLKSGAKIDRCIVHYVLGHSATLLEEFKKGSVTYNISPLAYNSVGKSLLAKIKQDTDTAYHKEQQQADSFSDELYSFLQKRMQHCIGRSE